VRERKGVLKEEGQIAEEEGRIAKEDVRVGWRRKARKRTESESK
jgi:hypothetical protein